MKHNRDTKAAAGRMPSDLKLASYNIHRCIGTDRRLDPRRVVKVIRELDADIIAVQEVDSGIYCRGGECQADLLGAIPGYQVVAGPTIRNHLGKYGNALMSRWPIRDVRFIDLSVTRREPRGAIDATLDVAGISVRVVALHLGLRAFERRTQYRKLNDALADMDGLTIVLGDFNEWKANARPIRSLKIEDEGTSLVKSFPSRFPVFPLDRIYASPGEVLGPVTTHVSRTSRYASDHLPIAATINLKALPASIVRERLGT